MKKHLIAAAVAAAVAVPAAAQVTVSGTLDINPWSSNKATDAAAGDPTTDRRGTQGATARSGAWTTSNLTFSGTEDLGGGLKAAFFFNQELRQSDGSENARDIWVALSGGFGELKIGRQPTAVEAGWGAIAVNGTTNSAGTSDSGGYDLIAGTLGATQTGATQFGTAGSTAGGNMSRQAGVIRYTTPNIGGLTFSVDLISNSADLSTAAGEAKNQQISGHALYAAGPLTLVAGYGDRDMTGTLAATGETATAETNLTGNAKLHYLGGAYNFGMGTLRYAYGAREDKSAASPSVVTSDITVHNVGLTIPVGALTYTLNYYDGEDDRAVAAGDERDLSGYQVAVRYALSKRTSAYLVNGQNKNEGAGANNTAKNTTTAIGVIHSF